jgi:regulator of ribonuclease activity A
MNFFTADMCDEHKDDIQIADPIFNSYGKREKFRGEIVTIKLDEDNRGLIELLKENGKGKVAVVDVGAKFCAVVGENLMLMAKENGWEGIIINGYVRDTNITKDIDVGLLALGTCPKRSSKRADAKRGEELEFAGVKFKEGCEVFVDYDGVVVK